MSDRPACIVVPAYRPELDDSERINLERLATVLGHHPIFLAVPQGFDHRALLGRLRVELPLAGVETFEARYFESIVGYNHLMLSDAFYRRFEQHHEYLLLHQTDAYTFHDSLAAWCRTGWDYLGAPWLDAVALPRRERWNRRLLEWKIGSGRVGNGGYSLRRIAAMRRLLADNARARDATLAALRDTGAAQWNEDVFFGRRDLRRPLHIPPWRTAGRFALECFLDRAFRETGGCLPMGCHAWAKFETEWARFYDFRQGAPTTALALCRP